MNPAYADMLRQLEDALRTRNPLLAGLLKPGLAAASIRRALADAGLAGLFKPLLALYGWHNGAAVDPSLALEQTGFFPGEIYQFIDLQQALVHVKEFAAAAEHCPHFGEGVGRYFPLFWDGSTGWLSVDLDSSAGNRLVIVDCEDPVPFQQAYGSFGEFLNDAIRANREEDALQCFEG